MFRQLFGISLHFEALGSEETTWADTVHKMAVKNEAGETTGYIYLDLYTRPEKPNGAAHYTVQCARRTDDDDVAKDAETANAIAPAQLLRVGARSKRNSEGLWQLPVVVLSCDFEAPSGSSPTLLSWIEVETLFHETGHALHCEYHAYCTSAVLN